MIELNCPSCGGQLELPENLDIVNCIYCGTKILIQDKDKSNEQLNLKRYLELSNTAIEVENYKEALKYCNKALEIDTNDVGAWINKAISTYWLSKDVHNRYKVFIGYLNKAKQLSPDDARILKARNDVKRHQSIWLNQLGADALKDATDIYYKYHEYKRLAQRESKGKYIEAMKYFLKAYWFAPDVEANLTSIMVCAKTAEWISWSKTVTEKIDMRELLQAKQEAIKQLPLKRKELDNAREKLFKLNSDTDSFFGAKSRRTENKISQLQNEITILEKSASYQKRT